DFHVTGVQTCALPISERVHKLALRLNTGAKKAGRQVAGDAIFDTVTLTLGSSADELIAKAEQAGYLLRRIDAQTVGITFDETSRSEERRVGKERRAQR